jgi:hypothetical protein
VAIQSAREGVSQLRLAQNAAVYDDIRAGVVSNTERFARNVGRESLIDPVAVPSYDDAGGRVSMEVTGAVITLIPFMQLRVTEHAEGSVERFESSAGGTP